MNAKPKILIVDDRPENLIALEKVLGDLDVEFVRALSGNEALAQTLEHDFAIALVDVQMPEMDGFETVEFMRQDKRTRHLPVIFVSAIYKEEYHQIRGIESGAVDFITKPVIPEIMRGKVRIFLDLYEYQQSLEDEIARRLQYEEALRESEEQYRDLFENASDLIQSVNINGDFEYVNSAWLGELGYDSGEVGQLKFVDIVAPDELDHCMTLFQEIVNGKQFENVETKFVAKDGRLIHVEGSVGARLKDGQFYASRGIFRDITERKRIEEKQRELDQMKSEFISNVSHELRTPLHSLKGFTKLMLQDTMSDKDVQKEFLGIMNKEADRLGDLIEDLLDVSRLEAGRFKIHKERVSVAEIMHDAVERLRNLAAEANIVMIEEISDELPEMEIDSKRIGQVMTNLVSNAIKYNKENGSVAVKGELRDNEVLVQVADQGIGIAEADIPHLFERFYRVEASDRIEGTGLGLHITQQIVEAHSGSIWIESQLGVGSIFTFKLPVHQNGGSAHE